MSEKREKKNKGFISQLFWVRKRAFWRRLVFRERLFWPAVFARAAVFEEDAGLAGFAAGAFFSAVVVAFFSAAGAGTAVFFFGAAAFFSRLSERSVLSELGRLLLRAASVF